MKIKHFFELDAVECIEPSYSALPDDYYTSVTVETDADEGRLLVDEGEYPIAVALHGKDGWFLSNFVFRTVTADLIEKVHDLGVDVYQEPGSAWVSALREYYCEKITEEILPAHEDNRPGRDDLIRELIGDIWGKRVGIQCIDCCCGSGVVSSVLREYGMKPLSYDNDPALLSLGLASGRLLPDETMWIDGTLASAYMSPVDAGIGCMLGDITNFNAGMWEEIVGELLVLTKETVITVATRPEVLRVEEWCTSAGRNVEIFENERDPIYDRWVCLAK